MSNIEKRERENFLRNAVLLVDHGKLALISLIEFDLQIKGVTFEQFLNNNQHEIFHMCFPKSRCCQCVRGRKISYQKVLYPSQIELLYDKSRKINASHVPRTGSNDFCCSLAKSNIALDVQDMTLARWLLVNFCLDVFWHYSLQYQGKSLEDFLNAGKHTIYHLWQYNTRCCHCPTVFNSTLKFSKLDQTEWLSLFNVASPQPPCSIQTQANAFPCNSLCDYEIRQTITRSSMKQGLQKTLIENIDICTLRKYVEDLVSIRNFQYGHAEIARMSDSDFEENKNTISEIFLNIAKLCGKEPEVQTALEVTLTESLDHKLVEKYKELMSEIYQNLQQQNEKIQELEANIVDTNTEIDVLRSSVYSTNNRFNDTNAELGRTNTRVDAINNSVDDTNAKLDRTNARVDDTTSELSRTNTRVDAINNIVDDTTSELSRTNTRVDVIYNRVDDTNAKLCRTNTRVDDTTSELSRTNTRVDAINNRVDDTDAKLGRTNARVDDTNTELDRTNTRVDDTTSELSRTNTIVDTINNRVDDTNAELARTNSRIDAIWNRVDDTHAELDTCILQTRSKNTDQRLGNVSKQVEDPVPPNIREQNRIEIEQWKNKDKQYVPSRASKHVYECVINNACVTITGPAGCGKTFLARHIALVLKKDGYDIIKIYTPKDIRDFYNPGRKTVFIVDDICGNFSASQEKIDNWLQFKDVVDKVTKDQNCKIIVSCRLQVYRDDNFKRLSHFMSCECNLVSERLCLSFDEKVEIIKKYTGEKLDSHIISTKIIRAGDFLPLSCFLYKIKSDTPPLDFLQNPFGKIKEELDILFDRKEDSSKYKICSLALCVIFNNTLEDNWFKGKVTQEQRAMLDDLSDACKLDRRLSKQSLKDDMNTLVDTFLTRQGTVFKAIHYKMFAFLAWYFGKKMTSFVFDHGDKYLMYDNFCWNLEENDMFGEMEYLVDIPNEYLNQYIERMVTDWSNGLIIQVFDNINMKNQQFRNKFLSYLYTQTQYNIDNLVEKKDDFNVVFCRPIGGLRESTALIQSINNGFLDFVEWLLSLNMPSVNQSDVMKHTLLIFAFMKDNVDIICTLLKKNLNVNLCNEDGQSPLWTACFYSEVNMVSRLLEQNSDVNLCDKDGKSPLWQACITGNVEIVSMLLEKDPNVNLCDKKRRSPLMIACCAGNSDVVSKLLQKNPDVNLCDEDGLSPLWVASANGDVKLVSILLEKAPDLDICGRSPLLLPYLMNNVDIVSQLLKYDPDVNVCDTEGRSMLLQACYNNDVDIVSRILKKDPDVNICNKYGESPLWFACFRENVEIVSKLLEKNPDVNLVDKDGYSPLLLACKKGNVEIIRLLLEKDPNLNLCDNSSKWSALWLACATGNVEIASMILERNPDVNLCNKDGQSPLLVACEIGSIEIVSKLLEKSPDVSICDDKYGCSPLSLACSRRNVEIVTMLLDNIQDMNFCDQYRDFPFCTACNSGNEVIVSKFLEKNADVNHFDEDRRSPLWFACRGGNVEIVLQILERNPDVNLCDKLNGQSPLWLACARGSVEIVSKLLEKEPKVNLCDRLNGQSPLWLACARGSVEIVSKLLEKDSDVNLCDRLNGQSPLWLACRGGNVEIVSKLLEKDPEVNLCDKLNGQSPLWLACARGSVEMVSKLLTNHAKVNICDKFGQSPLLIACAKGNVEIVSKLLQENADINRCNQSGDTPLSIALRFGL